MELLQGRRKAFKCTPEDDFFSSMPENVIINILHCLPIQEAVRTSILSRDWRFKWTMISQLVFDWDFFEYVAETENEDYYGRLIISRLLLQLKGSITKFTLHIYDDCYFENINNWVNFLSGRGIEEFTLINWEKIPLKLPTHLFSCPKLKHLKLRRCCFRPMRTLHGIPSLSSLELSSVVFQGFTFGEFLTRCPLLEILNIRYETISVVKRLEIPKLENLKVLSFPLCNLDNMVTLTSLSISQLMSCFPKLRELTLDFMHCKFLAEARNSIPSLPCLKTLALERMDFSSGGMVSCALDLICGSPVLQTLKIQSVTYMNAHPPPAFCSSEVDYSRMGQLQVREVSLEYIKGWENEVSLIKYLLHYSPLLKKMGIYGRTSDIVLGGDYGKMMFATELLKLHRASPIAKINLSWTV